MKHEILIYNKTRKRVPEKFIKIVIMRTLTLLKLKQPVELAVLVVDKEEIKRLNKIWREVNETPDELSFGLNSRQRVKFAKGLHSMLSLGEIIINAEKISDKNYLSEILIHSLLHLLGYNHRRMGGLEDKVIKKLEI
ncbi:MAG: rRNA maturation RNase YbeY [Candidatus Azambacteria bacterium]|nr:rRNA maturation RNase YbeY [Candidatus Azambacteria bacterium]